MIDFQAAEAALIGLAASWRGWDRQATADAILACRQAGWDDDEIFCQAARYLRRDDGEPFDLRNAARKPTAPGVVQPAEVARSWAAEARKACGFDQPGEAAV